MSRPRRSRRCFLTAVGASALAVPLLGKVLAQAPTEPKPRVLFFSRAGVYEHPIVHRQGNSLSVGERLLVDFGRQRGVDVECSTDGRVFDGDLEQFAAFVLYWNLDPTKPNSRGEPPVTARGKQRLLDAVAAGKGLLGIHCAAYATLSGELSQWQKPEQRDAYVRVLGGELCEGLPKQTCHYRIVSPEFPGLDKLKTSRFTVADEPYGLKNFADDLHVIAVAEPEGLQGKTFSRRPFPCIWARRHERGRVFYLSLGHDEQAWQSEPFQAIFTGGLDWVLGRVSADLTPNLSTVAPEADLRSPPSRD